MDDPHFTPDFHHFGRETRIVWKEGTVWIRLRQYQHSTSDTGTSAPWTEQAMLAIVQQASLPRGTPYPSMAEMIHLPDCQEPYRPWQNLISKVFRFSIPIDGPFVLCLYLILPINFRFTHPFCTFPQAPDLGDSSPLGATPTSQPGGSGGYITCSTERTFPSNVRSEWSMR